MSTSDDRRPPWPTSPTAVLLGAAVRARRQKLSLNLEHLSRLSGVGIATLSHFENGNRDPRVSTIDRILGALRCNLRELLEEAPALPPHSGTAGGYDLDL